MIPVVAFAILGLLAGAIVNRAADNLPPPIRKSILIPPRCAYCGAKREPWEQIFVVGFLLSRGRCRTCHSPLPVRGPVVELAAALLFVFLLNRFGLTWTTVGFAVMSTVLLLISVIDFEHRLILNVVVLPFTLITLLLSPILLGLATIQIAILNSIVGAVVGYLLVLVIYLFGKLFVRLMARLGRAYGDEVAFGLGDLKLAGLIGAIVGFPAVVIALVYAILFGGVGAIFVLIFQILVRKRYSVSTAIPYGPFIALAGWVVMVWGSDLGVGFRR